MSGTTTGKLERIARHKKTCSKAGSLGALERVVLVEVLGLLAVNTKGMGSANPITTSNFSVLGGVVLLAHQVLSTREMDFVEATNQTSKKAPRSLVNAGTFLIRTSWCEKCPSTRILVLLCRSSSKALRRAGYFDPAL